MLLSKAGYYADFVFYPLSLLPLGAVLLWGSTIHSALVWIVWCMLGMAGFSLLEYVLHRFVLHYVPPFRGMHDLHHAHPTQMVGTPTWATAALIGGGVFMPLRWLAGPNVACGATFGLILSYLSYGLVHHAVHRWPARKGSYLGVAKRRHSLHHHSHARRAGNFGVTSAFWDRIFGSVRQRTDSLRTSG